MEDSSLLIRRNKRGNDPKLQLSHRLISIVPSTLFQLSHLEILDLSNNKISSIDSQFQQLKNLKMLDLSYNNIILLEQFLCKMNISILNLSNNPLNEKFQLLLKTENQQAPLLKNILENCFSIKNTVPQWKTEKVEVFEEDFPKSKQPNWFDMPMNQTYGGQSKKDTVELLLKEEQQKVIGLQTQLEQLKLQQSQPNQNQEVSSMNDLEIDINEIELNKVISQGGFSLVYNGIFRGTYVAVKKIFDPNITQDLLDELNNELKMLARLRHPNIVLIMGVVTKPPNLCIITEYLHQGSLFNLLHQSQKEITFQDKVKIALQIARALNFLHLSKIVHKDVKSHNVLLDDNFRIKLCDFGLAKNFSELNKGSKQFCGTPCYMSPELFQKRSYSHKIDIFAYGTLLWEIFKREVPFEGQDPQDIMKKVLASQQLQNVEHVNQIVQMCRETNPDDRPEFKKIIQMLEQL